MFELTSGFVKKVGEIVGVQAKLKYNVPVSVSLTVLPYCWLTLDTLT